MSKPIDWVHWRRMERLPLGHAICLLLRINPESWLGGYVSRMTPPHDFSSRQRELYTEAKNMWDVAWASYHEGNLPMSTGMGGASVSMSDWLGWAHAKNFDVPPELADLIPASELATASTERPERASDQLTTKERNTLLVIIAALTNEMGIDLSQPSKASGAIAALTEKLGAPVTARAIENHVRAIPDAVESRRK